MLYTTYIQETYKLAKSFVIKLHITAVMMNLRLRETGLPIDNVIGVDDIRGWRYYRHLTGEYHRSDSVLLSVLGLPDLNGVYGIIIKSLDDENYHILTKEFLVSHTTTKTELLKMEKYYNDLVTTYPMCESLIRGILNPIDIRTAIKAKDGVILSYNKNLIQHNEVSLINDISKAIINYVDRWVINEYVLTDELYIHKIYELVTVFSIFKIINHRLSRVGTTEASEFHIDEFFKSNLNIASLTKNLTHESRIWLYKNLKKIIKHTGKNEILRNIIDKILIPNGLGVYDIELSSILPTVKNDNVNNVDLHPTVIYPNRTIKVDYNNKKTTRISSEYIFALQNNKIVPGAYVNEESASLESSEVIQEKNTLEPTKAILVVDDIKLSDSINIFDIVMDVLVRYAYTNSIDDLKYTVIVDGLQPMTINCRQAVLLIIELMLKLTGKEAVLLKEWANTTLINKNNPYIDNDLLYQYMNETLESLIVEVPSMIVFTDKSKISTFILEYKKWYMKYYLLLSNIDNSQSLLIEQNLSSLKYNDNTVFSTVGKNIQELMLEKDMYPIYSYDADIFKILSEVLLIFTGVEIDVLKSKKSYINDILTLIDRLTSYTTQILTEENNVVITGFMKTMNGLGELNISKVIEATHKCAEELDALPELYLDDGGLYIHIIDGNPYNIDEVSYLELPILQVNSSDLYINMPKIKISMKD